MAKMSVACQEATKVHQNGRQVLDSTGSNMGTVAGLRCR